MSEETTYLVDGNFKVTYPALGDFGFTFTVEETIAWADGRTPIEFERYLSGLIKWDSCCHFYFGEDGDGPGYLHMCGVADIQRHVKLMEALYKLAFQVMGRSPEPGEEWGDD